MRRSRAVRSISTICSAARYGNRSGQTLSRLLHRSGRGRGAVPLGLLVTWRQWMRSRTGQIPIGAISALPMCRMKTVPVCSRPGSLPCGAARRAGPRHRSEAAEHADGDTQLAQYIHAATNLDRPADATLFVHGAMTAYPNDKQSIGAATGHLGRAPAFSTKVTRCFYTRDQPSRHEGQGSAEFGYGYAPATENMSIKDSHVDLTLSALR